MQIPVTAADFTVDWMNAALSAGGHLNGVRVLAVEAVDSDIPGQTAEITSLALTYDDDSCPLPRHLIAKYTSRNPDVIKRLPLPKVTETFSNRGFAPN